MELNPSSCMYAVAHLSLHFLINSLILLGHLCNITSVLTKVDGVILPIFCCSLTYTEFSATVVLRSLISCSIYCNKFEF